MCADSGYCPGVAGIRSFAGFVRRNILQLLGLGMVFVVVRYVVAVQRARASVHGDWAVIVVIGLSAVLVPVAFLAGSFWWARRQPQSPSAVQLMRLAFPLAFALPVAAVAGVVYTAPAVIPRSGPPETVTDPVQLAAIAFMIPVCAGWAVLLAGGPVLVARWRRRSGRG
jgi:hypothetical protein